MVGADSAQVKSICGVNVSELPFAIRLRERVVAWDGNGSILSRLQGEDHMDSVVEKLLKEIEELERQIAAHPFGGLFDKKRSDQLYQKLRKKRKELANMLGCKLEQITLSELASRVPQGARERVSAMQAKLRPLAEELKKEHMSTFILLSECARFNSLLLRSVFDLGQTGTVYYNSNGATKRHVDMPLMNLEL